MRSRRGRKMRYMSSRQRQERARKIKRTVAAVCAVLALGMAAASPDARAKLSLTAHAALSGAQAAFAGRESATQELTLPSIRVYALQLGVYDSGERAQQEQQRLTKEGVPCILWQRERMRIVCAVAPTEDALSGAQTFGLETYAIRDEIPEVHLRLGAAERELEAVSGLMGLPDATLKALFQVEGERPLADIVRGAKELAGPALSAHGENALYSQLAQSIVNWCSLIERAQAEWSGEVARQYATVTMCTLCRELRTELLAQAQL